MKNNKRGGFWARLLATLLGGLCILCTLFACRNEEPPVVDYFQNATSVRVMSFNIRVGEQTEVRKTAVLENIHAVDADVFGVQEADPSWITYLTKNLTEYTLVGEGRDGGTSGEYAAIFYRTERFNLIQGGTKWLSLTPDKPSILEGGSQYKRVLTYAKLEDKETGEMLVHINAHLDYSSDEIARQQVNILAEYARIFQDYPIFITGDFNQTPDSNTYQEIVSHGYADSALATVNTDMVGTYNAYKTDETAHKRIDYCFVNEEYVRVDGYEVWNESAENGGHEGFISDHYAVYVDGKIINSSEATTEKEVLNSTIFQCGDRSYGDVSFNLRELGGSCTFANNTITLNVPEGETLTLDGFKTATNVSLKIVGGGEVVVNGNIVTNAFTTEDVVKVTVNGKISAKTVHAGLNTTINNV